MMLDVVAEFTSNIPALYTYVRQTNDYLTKAESPFVTDFYKTTLDTAVEAIEIILKLFVVVL